MNGLDLKALSYSRWVVVGWAIAAIVATVALTDVKFSSDTRVFFESESAAYEALRSLEARYVDSTSAYLALEAPIGEDFTDERAQNVLAELSERVGELPHAVRVDSLSSYQHVRGDAASFELYNPLHSPSGSASRQLRDAMVDNPGLRGLMISADLRAAGILVSFELPQRASNASEAIAVITDELRDIDSRLSARYPDFELSVGGMVPLIETFADATARDLTTLVPVSLVVAGLVLLICLRSLRLAGPLLVCTLISALATSGLAVLLGHHFNVATAVGPVVVIALVLTAGLHPIIALRFALRRGASVEASVSRAFRSTLKPSMLALATTLIGLLAINGAISPPLRALGNLIAGGVVLGYVSIYTLLPAFLCLTLRATHPGVDKPSSSARWVAQHQLPLFVVVALLTGVLALGLGRLQIDDSFSEYFATSFDYRQATDRIQATISGADTIEIDLPHPSGGQVTDVQYADALDRLVEWLRAQPDVVNVVALSDIFRIVSLALASEVDEDTDRAALMTDYLFLYEMSLPPGQNLTNLVDVERTASRVRVVLHGLSSQEIERFVTRLNVELDRAGYFRQRTVTGLSRLYAQLSDSNVRAMVGTTLVSIFAIAVVVAMVFRRLWYGLACLLVSGLPLVVAFGAWGLLFGDIGIPAAVVVAMTIGIVIDDAIHFLHRYQERFRQDSEHDASVEYALERAGRAMLLTTVALSAGFSVLVLSGFQVNRELGLMSCMIVIAALIYDLLLLPGLLKLSPYGARKTPSAAFAVRSSSEPVPSISKEG